VVEIVKSIDPAGVDITPAVATGTRPDSCGVRRGSHGYKPPARTRPRTTVPPRRFRQTPVIEIVPDHRPAPHAARAAKTICTHVTPPTALSFFRPIRAGSTPEI